MTLRRIRMERVDIEDVDPSTMFVLNLEAVPETSGPGDVEWTCGHCDEALLHRIGDAIDEKIVFRCPHCLRFSQLRQPQ